MLSVHGRAGAVVAASGDYHADQITATPSGGLSGATVGAQLTELDAEKAAASHASQHQAGGADAIKLDDLATPDDTTDLNASTAQHGLLPKLSGDANQYLNGTGGWSTPPGGGGGSTNAFGTIAVSGQSDVVADAAPDALTLAAGANVQITTDAATDTVTIAASHNHDAAYAAVGHNHDSAYAALSHSHDASAIGSGTIDRARLPALVGDSGSGGQAGAVPAPAAGGDAAGKYLKANGTWALPASGPEFADTVFRITDNADATKKLAFEVSAVATGTTRTLTLPNQSLNLTPNTGDFAAASHAARHASGGADALKLDDLAAPDDTTDLNASTTRHGLMPKRSGSPHELLFMDGAQRPVRAQGRYLELFDDFVSTAPASGQFGDLGWSFNAGTAAGVDLQNTLDTDLFGVGARASSAVSGEVCWMGISDGHKVALYSTLNFVEHRIQLKDTGSVLYRLGFLDQHAGDPPANGVYFELDTAVDVYWRSVGSNGGTPTKTNTYLMAFPNQWTTLRIERVTDGQVKFSIDGNLSATHTTGLPTGNPALKHVIQIKPLTGAAKTLWLDYVWARHTLSAARF